MGILRLDEGNATAENASQRSGVRRPDVLEVREMALPGRLFLPSFCLGKGEAALAHPERIFSP